MELLSVAPMTAELLRRPLNIRGVTPAKAGVQSGVSGFRLAPE
jgi:hypothetical protein